MSAALVTMSHSPLMGRNQPQAEVVDSVDAAFAEARRFVEDFSPDLVVLFAPDHYNGIFYDLVPPFCIGRAASSVGDYDTSAGPLAVDRAAATTIATGVLAAEVDVAISEKMFVDHGFAQPLELLFGAVDAVPVVPIFINAVALPLGPVRRARLLGEAVGSAAEALDRRVLFLGSGGLSHDPPVPQFDTAPPHIAEALISGRNPSAEARTAREARVLQAGRDFAAGSASIQPLNPDWDERVLDVLASGRLQKIDGWTNASFEEEGGHSAHEVRAWLAAYAALRVFGPYAMTSRFYRPIPEWIAGFGITTALPAPA